MDIQQFIGTKFGRWLVIREQGTKITKDPKHGWNRTEQRVLCKCDCGVEKEIALQSLRTKNTRSCGCLQKELAKEGWKHGLSHTPEHDTWLRIKTRCYNSKEPCYSYYGGKGIVVCDRWLGENGFMNFLTDMGSRPADKNSIDRIDSMGNYEPDNCRWSDTDEQANNKSNNVYITYEGKTQSLAQWAKEKSMSYFTLYFRIVRDKLPLEQAFTQSYMSKPKAGKAQRILTDDMIEEIYTTSIPSQELADKYKAEVSTIVKIRAGKSYSDITKNMIKGEKPKPRKLSTN